MYKIICFVKNSSELLFFFILILSMHINKNIANIVYYIIFILIFLKYSKIATFDNEIYTK